MAQNSQGAWRTSVEACRIIESDEVLLLDLNVHDEKYQEPMSLISQVQRDRPFVEDLPDDMAAAVMSVPDWTGHGQGTIHVFTDGSYLNETDEAGWAAIILMECPSETPFSYVGYIAGRQEAHSEEAGTA